MESKARQRIAAFVRYAICIGAISWVAWHTQWAELLAVWRNADRWLLVLSALAFGPAPVLIAVRLKWLLAVHDIRLSVWQAVKVTFAGNFVISALPVGTPGGDSLKAYYIARDTPHKHEAVTVVFFDRVIGVLGLVLTSGVVILCEWHNPAFAKWGRIIELLVVGMVVGGGLYFSTWLRTKLRLDALLKKLPLGQHLQRIDQAAFEFRQHPMRMLICLALSVVLQLNCVVCIFLAGWALQMVDGTHLLKSFSVYLGYTPVGLLAGALPIGVMETTFQQLFSSVTWGSPEKALLVSLFGVRFIQLVWALPGGLVVLRSRPKPEEMAAMKGPGVRVDERPA